jgi:hypothetical protein
MELIDVEVQQIEFRGAPVHPVEHPHVMGDRVAHAGIEPQRARHAGNESSGGQRILAGEQRDVMAEANQLLGQIGNNPLRTAIESWRDALHQRRDLCDFHANLSSWNAQHR